MLALVAGAVMVLVVHLSKALLLLLAGGEHIVLTLGAMISIRAVLYLLLAFSVRRSLILETVSLILAVFRGQRRAVRRLVEGGDAAVQEALDGVGP